ncbi:DUF2927 domain-containing protein [Oceanicella actignis]|uniref:DUF2927 domain-containing protein n=1 Tax=Oceanicella actignis TaxID=1189325 RepID=UPI0011E88AD9|nr:DUF2927 domain-containing protein [Oceanicella actignis]TYO90198.1 Protein of unknown function (DUF2927) [Oceanicella actignis]
MTGRAATLAAAVALALAGCTAQNGQYARRGAPEASRQGPALFAAFAAATGADAEAAGTEGARGADAPAQTLRKWQGPARVAFHGAPEAQDVEAARAAMARLRRLTRLDLRSADGEQAEIRIFVLPPELRRALAAQMAATGDARAAASSFGRWLSGAPGAGPCASLAEEAPGAPRGALGRAVIGVAAEAPARTRAACLEDGLSAALGLDFARVSPPPDRPTRAALLRLLYRPALRAGMPRAQALRLVRRMTENVRDFDPAPRAGAAPHS